MSKIIFNLIKPNFQSIVKNVTQSELITKSTAKRFMISINRTIPNSRKIIEIFVEINKMHECCLITKYKPIKAKQFLLKKQS